MKVRVNKMTGNTDLKYTKFKKQSDSSIFTFKKLVKKISP